jgi:translin
MDRLTETAGEALEILHNLEVRRERTIRCSRDIIRETKKTIHAIHVAEDPSFYKENLRRLVSEIDAADDADDALAEYAEAMILDSVVQRGDVPSFGDLGIGPRPWVLGLADCLGEMRRVVLISLMSEDVPGAVSMFSSMEEIFHVIMMFDVPDPILPIRRKQDIARGVMERTRTDITNAVMMSKLKI